MLEIKGKKEKMRVNPAQAIPIPKGCVCPPSTFEKTKPISKGVKST
jgi:hypothetical protein